MKKTTLAPMILGLLTAVMTASWPGDFQANAEEEPSPVSVFVELNASDMASMLAAIDQVEAHGGSCTHRFPFRGCIGRLPVGEDESLLAEPEVAGVYRGEVNATGLVVEDGSMEVALGIWDTISTAPGAVTVLREEDPAPILHDALEPTPDPGVMTEPGDSVSGQLSDASGDSSTSEFMIGSTAVAIIMPESDGSVDDDLETWSTERQDQVVAEIVAALDWWAAREPAAGLSFTYKVERSVPTGYEPITRSQSEEDLWISDVMDVLGYEAGDRWTLVREYVNDLRATYTTDWAFVAFVVDDLKDEDNKFAENANGYTYFAYAYLGGPFMVMTYGNNGYGPTNMDAVMAHETGHIFLALDAYADSTDCDVHGGYLYVENSNSLSPEPNACGMNEACIMRGQVSPYTAGSVSPSAEGQIGWLDSDEDGILDPVDTNVGLSVWSSGSSSSADGVSWTVSGVALDYPWESPYRDDVTINTVATVDWAVDGGTSHQAAADDGAWDESQETFTFETGVLSAGVHTVTVRAENSVGNTFSYDLVLTPAEQKKVFLPYVAR